MALKKFATIPLMTKRMHKHKPDPAEELYEVYDDVKEIEDYL